MSRRWLAKLTGKQPDEVRPVRGKPVEIDIVGESHYEANLRAVLQQYGEGEFDIVLQADPSNPYDGNCVNVLVHGQQVGNLARGMAEAWQPMILAAESEGYTVVGRARLLGGTNEKPNLGVFGTAPWPGRDRPPDKWGR